MKIKKNDKVKLIAGKDKGKTGKVIKVFLKEGKILVEGLNVAKKHIKPKKQREKGQIVSFPMPLNFSNTMLVCPNCGIAARVGFVAENNNNKARICKKCKTRI
ncbi:MAG: 50S ribosomal protein L24 [Patescibacteria group bacterium]|nr:50S ribosomal protein L24 [Patescibacteria group bacterium]